VEDKQATLSSTLPSTDTLMASNTLMAGKRQEELGESYKMGRKPQVDSQDCILSQDTSNTGSASLPFPSRRSIVVLPARSIVHPGVEANVGRRKSNCCRHIADFSLVSTGPLRRQGRFEDQTRLTLAVAVAGCASTVGVGALTAATHIDWSERLLVGGKRLVLV
jgi:hypothetical protein